MKVLVNSIVIDPQPSPYHFVSMPPKKIGDQAYIRVQRSLVLVDVLVILLADRSGRQWLVQTK
jgi:hypothetical protein